MEALQRIPIRFKSIKNPQDFLKDEAEREHLDSICMILLAVGEAFHRLDKKTNGKILSNYPNIPWRDVIGVRNIIAHGYFDIDAEQVFNICKEDIPELIKTVKRMIIDLQEGNRPS